MKKNKFLWFACCGLLLCGKSQAVELPLSTPVAGGGARVVIVEDPQATQAFKPRSDRVLSMVNKGIERLSSQTNLAAAWKVYVSTQDVVGIKIISKPGPNTGTRPDVVEAVVSGLLSAGLPAQNIIIWDRQLSDLRRAGFADLAARYNVRLAGSADCGYDEKTFYENAILGTLVWGDLEFGRKDTKVGRKSYVSKLLTQQVTKIINIAPLLNHNVAGVNGCLTSLALGSVDNSMRFEGQAARMAGSVPEIYAMAALSDHVVLNIMDALIAQYEGEELSLLHYSAELNQLWFSKDPVALDVLAVDELERTRRLKEMPIVNSNAELYQNATLLELGVSDLKRIRTEMVK